MESVSQDAVESLVAQVAEDFSKVTLLVANRFKLDWIRAQYAGRIAALLEGLYGQPVTLELAIAQREAVTRTYVRPASQPQDQRAAPSSSQASDTTHGQGGQSTPGASNGGGDESSAGAFRNRLNPALTFETLVEGTANRMARSAAMHVAGMPGHLYNPLFIYGGVGLGKTHLVHAVGNRLLQDKPDAKILYIHAEQFVSDVVKAYQRRTFDEFKERYHSLDLLLIDDIQFLSGKQKTQEIFFHIFNQLHQNGKQIILTSDRPPKDLEGMEDRLISRLNWGLVADIKLPDLETRVAILRQKAEQDRIAEQQRLEREKIEKEKAELGDLLEALAVAFAEEGRAAALEGDGATADRAAVCFSRVLRATRELDRNASPQLTVEALFLDLRG